MAQTMREENGSHSFLDEFFDGILVDDSDLNQVFNKNPFGKQMHVLPVYSRPKDSIDSFLRFIDCVVDLSLLLGEFSTNWECDCLICAISVPFSAHVM